MLENQDLSVCNTYPALATATAYFFRDLSRKEVEKTRRVLRVGIMQCEMQSNLEIEGGEFNVR